MNLKLVRIIDYYLGIPLIQFLRLFKLKKNKIGNSFNPKKILIIKFFGLGNIILASPVLYFLKKKFPEAEIHYLTLSNNEGVLENYKEYVSKPIYLELKGAGIPFQSFSLFKNLRKEKYDLVMDLDQFSRYSAIVSSLLGAKISIGYKTKGAKRHYIYDAIMEYKADRHVTDEFVNMLGLVGIKIKEKIKLLPLKTGPYEKKKIEKWLDENNLKNKKIMGMHAGVGENAPQKKWPYFKELIENVLSKTNYSIVLTAGPSEYADGENLISQVDSKLNPMARVKISKGIKLNELPALMDHFKLFVSNDTGPLHMAAAQGINVIGLYGPATPEIYGPYTDKKRIFYKKLKCSPCLTNFNNKETKCGTVICMKEITVDEVFSIVRKI
jgi:ADP-heptose:LPS heptosyltransferase